MLELRPLQTKTIEAVRDAFRKYKRVLLYAPTGFGKTEIAIAMMDATRNKGNKASMILDRIVLCEQTSKRLEKYNIPHGVLQSGHERYRPYEPLQVCSAQTLEARGTLPMMKLATIDEAHCKRKMVMEFIDNADVYVLGLSASPFTKGLGKHYDHVVSTVTTKQLVDDGWLVPLKVYIAKEIDMEGAKKVGGEWSVKEVTARGTKLVADVVTEWEQKTLEHFGKPEKTIVFCAGVKHGEELEAQFQANGYNFVNISYRDNDDYKKAVLESFSEPDTDIVGVIATDILSKGFDGPDVKIGVSARPFSKSFSSHVQQMGRVMRTHESKDYALWLCHSGNFLRFWDDWDYLYKYGVTDLDTHQERTKKEPTKTQKEAAKCPRCNALWEGGDTCRSCGFTLPKGSQVVTSPGEMVALEEAHKKQSTKETQQEWYSQLLCYARKKGYQEGWASHKFKEKFKQYPNGLHKNSMEVGEDVGNWIKYLNIRRAKRNAA